MAPRARFTLARPRLGLLAALLLAVGVGAVAAPPGLSAAASIPAPPPAPPPLLYHGWSCPLVGCNLGVYDTLAKTAIGGSFPLIAGDTPGCAAWKVCAARDSTGLASLVLGFKNDAASHAAGCHCVQRPAGAHLRHSELVVRQLGRFHGPAVRIVLRRRVRRPPLFHYPCAFFSPTVWQPCSILDPPATPPHPTPRGQ